MEDSHTKQPRSRKGDAARPTFPRTATNGTDGRSRLPADRRLRRSPKTSEVIARDLANYIIGNNLPEGAMLPVEKEMLESLGVGRTTLREALRLLETRGVLVIRAGPKGGPVVRHPVPEQLGDALTLILQFEGASLSSVFEARNALEPMLAELAAVRITDGELDQLDNTIANMLQSADDHDVFLDENRRFHSIIARASGSVVLRVFLETLKSVADGSTVGVEYTPRRRKAVAEIHQSIADALRAHDAGAAAERMHKHLQEAAEYWQRKYPDLYDRTVKWIG
jgi:GntR family transcriptional repressor for pyruvate dehydrogenase complex